MGRASQVGVGNIEDNKKDHSMAGALPPPKPMPSLISNEERAVAVAVLHWMDANADKGPLSGLQALFAKAGHGATFESWISRGDASARYLATHEIEKLLTSAERQSLQEAAGIEKPIGLTYALKTAFAAVIAHLAYPENIQSGDKLREKIKSALQVMSGKTSVAWPPAP